MISPMRYLMHILSVKPVLRSAVISITCVISHGDAFTTQSRCSLTRCTLDIAWEISCSPTTVQSFLFFWFEFVTCKVCFGFCFMFLFFMSFILKLVMVLVSCFPFPHVFMLLVPLFNVSGSDWLSCSLCHVLIGLFMSCDPLCLL